MSIVFPIIGGVIVVALLVGGFIYDTKKRKKALDAKPKDDRIYKVFEIIENEIAHYVVKHYYFCSLSNTHSWLLWGNSKDYENLTKDDVIELCDRLNDTHIKNLNAKRMTRMLEDTSGRIIH